MRIASKTNIYYINFDRKIQKICRLGIAIMSEMINNRTGEFDMSTMNEGTSAVAVAAGQAVVPCMGERIINKVMERVVPAARKLAADYRNDSRYATNDERIAAMIRWETGRNAALGFATGVGGGWFAVFGTLGDIAGSLYYNCRVVAAIADLNGYDLDDERVRTAVLLAAVGSLGEEALKDIGIKIGEATARALIMKIPRRLIGRINKLVGVKLFTKVGQRGVVRLVRIVPFVGGVVGAVTDGVACHLIAKGSARFFRPVAA